MNKSVYPGQAILDLNKMPMYKFHYDYRHSMYGSKTRLCYINTDSFVYEIETWYFKGDIAKDLEANLDTIRYLKDDNISLPTERNRNVTGMIKEKLRRKIMNFTCRY